MVSKDITGQRFNCLTALKEHHTQRDAEGHLRHYWLFRCACGKEKVILKTSVTRGATKSCGCLSVINHTKKHGLTNIRLHKIWIGMKSRCYDKNKNCYHNYGGKGIKVCALWKSDFMAFYKWATENGYKEGLTIDRIDSTGNYCPENCRWATRAEQNRNTKKNVMITYNGETLCLREMSRKYDVHWATASYRLKQGKPLEEVFRKVKKCV